MAKAKKLPSGSWRCQVYDYTDDNKRKHYKSFTAPSKKGAEYAAMEYMLNKENETEQVLDMTLTDAVKSYIESKENILSPATVIGYQKIARKDMALIEKIKLDDFDKKTVQSWINSLSKRGLSPKSVKNAYNLFSATMGMFSEKTFKPQLPQRKKNNTYVPSDGDIKLVLANSTGDLQIAIYLAAFGGLRRGEICALTRLDVHNGYITVNKSMGLKPDRTWEVKPPKTTSSERDVDLPDFLIQLLKKKTGRIISTTPDMITLRFIKLVKKLGVEHFRFHDLRHYYVSINHAIGIPDAYIMEQGGWKSDHVMKGVYLNTIRDEKKKFADISKAHFETIQYGISHEISHEIKKVL